MNNSFNQKCHFRGKGIHVHSSNAFGENKNQENETSKKTMKHKSKHRVFFFILKKNIWNISIILSKEIKYSNN